MERVLSYNPAIVPQEYYWDCGPASAQIILANRNIIATENELIAKIGTTVNGTDYVGLVERVLNQYLPEAKYQSVYMQQDPPTGRQKDKLWGDIVRSIDAGYGVVANIVAPPSNYPRGVKGSTNPTYGGGTVYHYLTVMGYDVENAAVLIADPGFQPYVYWISFAQLCSLIPPKGYAAAHVDGVVSEVDRAQLLCDVMGDVIPLVRYHQLLPAFSAQLVACDCTSVLRIAMNVAQLGHESVGLKYTEEIASGAAYEGRGDLGNTQPGDGVRFKGRSWIQITGRSNYTRLSQWAFEKGLVPSATFFVDNPAALSSDQYAGLGAAWYWVVARSDINALSDARDLVTVTQRINGGQNGIDDRRSRYNGALALGDRLLALLPTESPATEQDGFMAALTDDQQRELYANVKWLREQLDVNTWGPSSSMGQTPDGKELTVRDGLAEDKRSVEKLLALLSSPGVAIVTLQAAPKAGA